MRAFTAAVASSTRPLQRSLHTLQRPALGSRALAAALTPCHLQRPSSAAPACARRSVFSYPTSRTLDEIVKLPLLLAHPRDEVLAIWRAQHSLPGSNNSALAESLTAAEHATFTDRAARAPLFVVPCFKVSAESASAPVDRFDVSSGFEMMLVNVQQSSLLLTSLEEYKLRGAAAATPFALVTLYTDLSASHDLVLLRAEQMDVSVSAQQLRAMWILLRELYADASAADTFERFAAAFNRKPNPTFDFDAFIAWCKQRVEKIELDRPKSTMADAPDDTPAAQFEENTAANEAKDSK